MNGRNINDEANKTAMLAMRVPGQIRKTEAAALYKMGRRLGNLVEIGCLHGRSTVALVEAAKKFKATVTSVDPFYTTPNINPQSSPEIWQANLEAVGLKAPNLLAMESHQAAAVYNEEISFLFIDGAHDYEHVKEDIADWVPKVKVSGVIAFHDMFLPHADGVTKAVTEWWLSVYDRETTAWKYENMTDYLIAFRRVM